MKTILLVFMPAFLRNVYSGDKRIFPSDFLFGASTSAYQTEGAWAEDDKGESIWDHMVHNSPWMIRDRSNGDITSDSYHNYKRDVEMIRQLGLNAYRFSISWPRILPTGFDNDISVSGVDFYNNFINELIKFNITPIVTLYHFDLPQRLQVYGGFVNPQIADWFEDYVRVVFAKFGDRVKHWITFSDPNDICEAGYAGSSKAPYLKGGSWAKYTCAMNLLISHASAFHLYQNDFKGKQGGAIGIAIRVPWFVTLTNIVNDTQTCEMMRQFEWGLYTDPIFSVDGGFPRELVEYVARKSREHGYSSSRLPEFTEEERRFVRGTFDFLGLNHFTAAVISTSVYELPNEDVTCDVYRPVYWPQSASNWLKQAPNSLYNVLLTLKTKYHDLPILITANGWSTAPGASLHDDDRISYIRSALDNVIDSIDNGVKVFGYMVWTLMDSFEWASGFTERFGLFQVDFADSARRRTPRKSAAVYKQIITTRTVDYLYQPTSISLNIS